MRALSLFLLPPTDNRPLVADIRNAPAVCVAPSSDFNRSPSVNRAMLVEAVMPLRRWNVYRTRHDNWLRWEERRCGVHDDNRRRSMHVHHRLRLHPLSLCRSRKKCDHGKKELFHRRSPFKSCVIFMVTPVFYFVNRFEKPELHVRFG